MITCYFENKRKKYLRHVVAGAIIVKNNKVLLQKRAKHLKAGGKYCIFGGYLEQGETIARGVKREIMEESGYETKSLKLFRINDNPQRDIGNVDFIFIAQLGKKVGKKDKETEELCWFDLDKLPPKKDFAFDHWQNFQLYRKYKKKKFSLPMLG